MARARTIVLQLLREGPPHNQLLSPLTPYLAACQNRPPESLRLTVEHHDFLRWQAGLTYAGIRDAASCQRDAMTHQVERRNAIEDATWAVTAALGSIRALIAELTCEPCEWRHIHIVVDASELGALPFELARASPGLFVEGDRLFAQQNVRITLTRQTRRVATSVMSWPRRPRILCVIGDGALPADAHVLALRKNIDPWLGWRDSDDSCEPQKVIERRVHETEQMLTVLDNPTLNEIAEAARKNCFTHVHILAHGAPLPDAGPGQTLYGICFRDSKGEVDVVDGDRLEAAIRQPRDCSHPTVITLATCEGANTSGAVLGPGGSVAHSLHSKGVPLVVASQFPLSKGASVIATESLYRGLLRGEDPRETLHAIRRELIAAYPATHDWASLVMYASFPNDLEHQLSETRAFSDKLACEAAVERLRWPSGRTDDNLDRLDRAFSTLRRYTEDGHGVQTRVRANRVLAALTLRLWDIRDRAKQTGPLRAINGTPAKHDFATGQRAISTLDPDELIEFARNAYSAAYFLDGSRWELWIQVIVLCWVQGADRSAPGFSDLEASRYLARQLSERSRKASSAACESALAAALAFEVELLAYLAGRKQLEARGGEEMTQTLDALFEQFIEAASPVSESYRAYAAFRQLVRYQSWAARQQVDTAKLKTIETYRRKLESLGVRRFWGPRA